MSYDAWEANSGEALNQVAIFCRHLLKNELTFSETSQPPASEVEIYLSNNHAKMCGKMARYGLSSVQTDATVIRILQSYLVSCTVVDVEMTHAVTSINKVLNARFESFKSMCDGFDTALQNGEIQTLPGIIIGENSINGTPEWTGASKARKALLAADTDLVQPDITRDMMKSNRVYPWYDE